MKDLVAEANSASQLVLQLQAADAAKISAAVDQQAMQQRTSEYEVHAEGEIARLQNEIARNEEDKQAMRARLTQQFEVEYTAMRRQVSQERDGKQTLAQERDAAVQQLNLSEAQFTQAINELQAVPQQSGSPNRGEVVMLQQRLADTEAQLNEADENLAAARQLMANQLAETQGVEMQRTQAIQAYQELQKQVAAMAEGTNNAGLALQLQQERDVLEEQLFLQKQSFTTELEDVRMKMRMCENAMNQASVAYEGNHDSQEMIARLKQEIADLKANQASQNIGMITAVNAPATNSSFAPSADQRSTQLRPTKQLPFGNLPIVEVARHVPSPLLKASASPAVPVPAFAQSAGAAHIPFGVAATRTQQVSPLRTTTTTTISIPHQQANMQGVSPLHMRPGDQQAKPAPVVLPTGGGSGFFAAAPQRSPPTATRNGATQAQYPAEAVRFQNALAGQAQVRASQVMVGGTSAQSSRAISDGTGPRSGEPRVTAGPNMAQQGLMLVRDEGSPRTRDRGGGSLTTTASSGVLQGTASYTSPTFPGPMQAMASYSAGSMAAAIVTSAQAVPAADQGPRSAPRSPIDPQGFNLGLKPLSTDRVSSFLPNSGAPISPHDAVRN